MTFDEEFSSSVPVNYKVDYVPERAVVKNSAPVDQFDGESFNLNDNGFIRNDICQLMRATSASEYDAKLRSLAQVPESSLPVDMSIQDCLDTIIPRYSQSPAELAAYSQVLAERDINRLERMKRTKVDNSLSDLKKAVETNSTTAVETKSE